MKWEYTALFHKCRNTQTKKENLQDIKNHTTEHINCEQVSVSLFPFAGQQY